ncbi:hypothetical protein [Photorhabdus akhurstii]
MDHLFFLTILALPAGNYLIKGIINHLEFFTKEARGDTPQAKAT